MCTYVEMYIAGNAANIFFILNNIYLETALRKEKNVFHKPIVLKSTVN